MKSFKIAFLLTIPSSNFWNQYIDLESSTRMSLQNCLAAGSACLETGQKSFYLQTSCVFITQLDKTQRSHLSKQRLAHWVVDAINISNWRAGCLVPTPSLALFWGVPLQEFCSAAAGATPCVFYFTRLTLILHAFYKVNIALHGWKRGSHLWAPFRADLWRVLFFIK